MEMPLHMEHQSTLQWTIPHKQTSWKQLHLLLCKLSNFRAFPWFFLVAGSLKNLFHCKLGAVGNKGKKTKSNSPSQHIRNLDNWIISIKVSPCSPSVWYEVHYQCQAHPRLQSQCYGFLKCCQILVCDKNEWPMCMNLWSSFVWKKIKH